MTEGEEKAYVQGGRAAWLHMLQMCLQHLGYTSKEAKKSSWVLEREAAIAQLRDVCERFGDNDWNEDLHLGDVIEKHLAKRLFAEFDTDDED